jgi:hypothetical protein
MKRNAVGFGIALIMGTVGIALARDPDAGHPGEAHREMERARREARENAGSCGTESSGEKATKEGRDSDAGPSLGKELLDSAKERGKECLSEGAMASAAGGLAGAPFGKAAEGFVGGAIAGCVGGVLHGGYKATTELVKSEQPTRKAAPVGSGGLHLPPSHTTRKSERK